jgi:hypothetical protein
VIIRRADISPSIPVEISCNDDLSGDVQIIWFQPYGPAPAIGGAGDTRPVERFEAIVPAAALMKGWDNCWPSRLPEGVPAAVAAAVIATLAIEKMRLKLDRLLSEGPL